VTKHAMPDAAPNTADLFEIIRTTRSMRRLKPDLVPNDLIRKILEAGVCAPSGGNMQRWRFLVIRDAKIKETVGAYYKRAWDEQVAPRYRSGEPAPSMSRERFLRLLDAAEYLAAHIHEAPVWIVPCLEGGTPTRTSGSSIACSEFGGNNGGSTGDLWPVIDHEFRPAASHIRRGPGEADRLSARIGPQTQRKQIGETERSFDVEPVVRFQPDADRECWGGKALQCLSRAGKGRI
jgi:nitroreductase